MTAPIRHGGPIAALVAALAAVTLTSCGEQSCTEIDCDSTSEVGYNFVITGPYDLSLALPSGTYDLRCNDPDWPLLDEQPDFISCGANGFSMVGEEANASSVTVTIYDVDNDEVRAANQVVDLIVPGEPLEPNGPGCPPICFERYGQVLGDEGP